MRRDELIHHLSTFRGTIKWDESMASHTSLHVGGPADLFLAPADLHDLATIVAVLQKLQIPYLLLGGGYNMLVQDKGIRGAVIALDGLKEMQWLTSHTFSCQAGASNLAVVRFAQSVGMGGISFISGVPGTIGGALRMNAGAYGQSILPHVISLELLRDGNLITLPQQELVYSYRTLELQHGDIIVGATIQVAPQAMSEIEEEIQKDAELRQTKHCVGYPSAGSFFKNPQGGAAWKLIDAAGMRGHRCGDAQFSEIHSNFLVNRGQATAKDCLQLVAEVKQAVLAHTGVLLDEEVRIVGDAS